MERIAWELNFHQGEEVSLNQLAESTDLSWATVRKYIQLLEDIQKIAPQIEFSEEGVYPGQRTQIVEDTFSNPESALVVYILIHSEIQGGATKEVDIQELEKAIEDTDVLKRMEQLGWIERSEDQVRLTSLGLRIAGKTRSKIESHTRDVEAEMVNGWYTHIIPPEKEKDNIESVYDTKSHSEVNVGNKSEQDKGREISPKMAARGA